MEVDLSNQNTNICFRRLKKPLRLALWTNLLNSRIFVLRVRTKWRWTSRPSSEIGRRRAERPASEKKEHVKRIITRTIDISGFEAHFSVHLITNTMTYLNVYLLNHRI